MVLHLSGGGKRGGRFETMKTYILRRQNTVAQYISRQPILDLYEAVERKWGERVGMWWCKQAGLNLEGAREMAAAAVEGYEYGLEE